jgi:hypothetical protein
MSAEFSYSPSLTYSSMGQPSFPVGPSQCSSSGAPTEPKGLSCAHNKAHNNTDGKGACHRLSMAVVS